MSRIINVLSTQGDNRLELNTSAANWGDAKKEINANGTFGDVSGATAMIGGSRQILDDDSTTLPVGSCIIYITPSKVKSGANNN